MKKYAPPLEEEKKLTYRRSTAPIPVHRLMIYALIVSFLPILLSWFFVSHSVDTAERSLRQIKEHCSHIEKNLLEQAENRHTILSYSKKDPLFINKNIESIHPLQREEAVLRELIELGGLPDTPHIDRRYKQLSSGANSFSFVESAVTMAPLYKETTETQSKPVELDEEDLIQVLSLIEGDDDAEILSTRPQLIVIDGSLERRKGYDREVWALSMKIVKRLYTAPISIPYLPAAEKK